MDDELCTGCGVCVDRCQMDAIILIDDKSSIKKTRCIGCGNCIATCPVDAIKLIKKDKITEPPKGFDDLYGSILEAKNQVKEKQMKRKLKHQGAI